MSDALSPSTPAFASRLRAGLSAKLIGLTIAFVLIAEVLIYVPSIANFRERWFADRLARAQTVALVLAATPGDLSAMDLPRDVLDSAGITAISVKMTGADGMMPMLGTWENADIAIDMRTRTAFDAVYGALDTLFSGGMRTIGVLGAAPREGDYLEITVSEATLRTDMLAFSRNILILSLVISAITAALVFVALNRLIVRPVRQLAVDVMAFANDPEDRTRILTPSGRGDELGLVERELAAMQGEIHAQLAEKGRLAALGLAVAKINHDLRNLLASAQLISERLAASPDPAVKRLSGKIMAALERAIGYCEATLSYGSAREAPPQRANVPLAALVDEVRETLGLQRTHQADDTLQAWRTDIDWLDSVPDDLAVSADAEQLFRILVNLVRNSVEALELQAYNTPALPRRITVEAARAQSLVRLVVEDTGPGLPPMARAHLFQPFHGSARAGGTGLGLAIAAELARAQGGTLTLDETAPGARFILTLPAPVPATV